MIYPVNDVFVISSHGSWLPGNYATEQAAQFAFQLSNTALQGLQERINWGEQRPITTDDLRAARDGASP